MKAALSAQPDGVGEPPRLAIGEIAHMFTLQDAAERAYRTAKDKQLALVSVAERTGGTMGAVEWFARSIAEVVPVYARGDSAEHLDKLAGAGASPKLTPKLTYVSKKDFERYLRWARTVQ